MKKTFFSICSMLLVLVLLANLLPLQVFATQYAAQADHAQAAAASVAETVPGQIVEELIHKRTEYTKQFRLDNGLFIAAVYDEPVHYAKDGAWAEIDNTLRVQTDGTYRNTAGVWNVSFPDTLSGGKQISVTKDGHTLSFSMAGELRTGSGPELMSIGESLAVTQAQAAPALVENAQLPADDIEYPEMAATKLHGSLRYNNIYGTTDIRYQLQSNTVKESIILESYSSTLRGYRYSLEVGSLQPVLQDDGRIVFLDSASKAAVMVMEAPFMVDAALEYNYDVQVQLTGSGSRYTLTYLLPTAWLASTDRAWPVVLDPVITADLAATNIRDQTVTENTTHSYTRGINECGHCTVEGIQRFFMKYVQLPELSSSDVIVGATVEMYKPQTSTTTATVQVHKVLGSWDSDTITWQNKPDYNPTIEDFLVVRELGWYQWDITDIARSWYEGENTGMMFRVDDSVESSTGNNWKQFYSSNYSDYPTLMPKLRITFRNNNGLESYWDYTASSAGRAGTGYVNQYTGNLVWIRSDIGFGGNRMPVSISHIYNANDAANNDFGMGNGWRTNYNQLVYHWEPDTPTDGDYYCWEDSDGTDHYFKYVSSGTYKDEDGLELTLTVTGSGDNRSYTITDKTGNTSHFDHLGRLVELENNQETPSSIEIAYSGDTNKFTTITDGAGRTYHFTYNSSDLLTRIGYKGSGSNDLAWVTYEYTGSRLTRITDKDGKSSQYDYSLNLPDFDQDAENPNLLIWARDIDGYQLDYRYNTMKLGIPARVHTIQETDGSATGGSLTITYQHNQTTMVDQNNNRQILQFNNMGNTICIQDGEGRAQYAQFAKNSANETTKGNQLRLASKLQYTVANMLPSGSFESTVSGWSASTTGASISRSTAESYIGEASLQVTQTAASAIYAQGPSIQAAAGETYVFSAYVKTADIPVTVCLGSLAGETVPAGSDWTRVQVSYTNTAATAVTLQPGFLADAAGSYYADCVQLEKAPTASRYNLVENGDFRDSFTGWTKTNCATTGTIAQATRLENGVTVSDAAAPQLDNTVFRLSGSATYEKRLTQTIQVSGDEGDSFVFAGWAKGNSTRLGTIRNYTREFALRMRFVYTDGSNCDYFTAQFNPDSDQWQYTAAAAVATKDYSAIELQIVYDNNLNVILFDGIQLFREQFGVSYTYDENGNVLSTVDLQNQKTQYEYTANNLTKIIEPGGEITRYNYDDHHNVTSAVTKSGQVYFFTYDDWGNNTSVSVTHTNAADSENPQNDVNAVKITTTATYTTDGNYMASTTDALGNTTTYGYDPQTGVLNWVQYPEDTASTRTNYTYDTMYRMADAALTTDTGLTLVANYYYTDDLLSKIETPSTTYIFTYGDFALRDKIQVGSKTLASYTYTNDGNHYLQTLAYGNGDYVNYTYDNQGRVTRQTYEDQAYVSYQYDNSGNLATVTDSEGLKTTYYYDLTDRMAKYVETDDGFSHSVGYEYNEKNNLVTQVEIINGAERTTSYEYNVHNQVESITTGGVTVTYNYDDYGRVTSQVTHRGDINNSILTETFTYVENTDGSISTQIATHTSTATHFTQSYSYTYDGNGNILTKTDGNGFVNTYTYDSANQLIRLDCQRLQASWVWTYDNAGNILSENKYAYTTGELSTMAVQSTASAPDMVYPEDRDSDAVPDSTSDSSLSLRTSPQTGVAISNDEEIGGVAISSATPTSSVTYNYDDDDWNDLMTGYTKNGTLVSLRIDEIGNPEFDGTNTYTWKHGKQIDTLTRSGVTWTYEYNADGLRTARTSANKDYFYVYNGTQLTQVKVVDKSSTPNVTNIIDLTYDAAGQPLTMTLDGTTYFYLLDATGEITGLLGEDGNRAVEYICEGYGKSMYYNTGTTAYTLSSIDPLAYRGYVYDYGTGLYYLQSRSYNYTTGRFINADGLVSTGQGILGHNMFAYCHNNPMLYVDPSGCIIVLASDASEAQISEYYKAIEYLKTSATGKKLINLLESSQETIIIDFVDDNKPRYNSLSNTIYFDTNCGLILGDGTSVMSPALALAHEMGHAAQDLAGVMRTYNTDPNIIEPLNLQTIEIPIAKELGEPTRSNYFDTSGVMDMQSSTHFRTTHIRQWWKYLLPWNWFKPHREIIDHY